MTSHKKSTLSKSVQKPIPVKIVHDIPSKSIKSSYDDNKWRAEEDLRALQRAEEIRADKARMKAAKHCAKIQIKNLEKVK